MIIVRMLPTSPSSYFSQIAKIHAEQLSVGFLAKLGPQFLTRFYRFLSTDPKAVLFAAIEDVTVAGFVLATVDNKTLFKKYLLKQGFWVVWYYLPIFFHAATFRRIFSLGRYLSQSSPKSKQFHAELLSIAVAPEAHRRGIGNLLFSELSRYYSNIGIEKFIVTAAETQLKALKFYESMGAIALDESNIGGLRCTVFLCCSAVKSSSDK